MNEIFKVIPAKEFRNTSDVQFHLIPVLDHLKSIDLVTHGKNAISPGPIGEVKTPWYMHPHQVDNLIVFQGHRHVELYTKETGVIFFDVTPDKVIDMDGNVLHEGPAILSWNRDVFHRVTSGEEGSISVNFAVHEPGFDIETNFNIYRLDTESGEYGVAREGHLDQKTVDPE